MAKNGSLECSAITLSQAASCARSTASPVRTTLTPRLPDLIEILRIAGIGHAELRGRCGEGGVAQDRLDLRRQRIVLCLVENDLEGARRPVMAAHHVEFRHVGKAELKIGAGIVQSGGVEQAAVHDRHDLAAGQNGHRCAELPEHIGGKSFGPVADALEVIDALDFLLEPAERLGRHRKVEQAVEIELEDVVDQLPVQRLPAARVEPGQHAVRVPAERRRAAEQRRGLVLAIPGVADAVTAIENSGMHGVLHLKGRHDRARRQHIEFQPPAGHLLDLLGVVDGELVENVPRRPCRLESPDRRLRARHLRHRHDRGAGGPAATRRRATVAAPVIRLAMPIYIASPRRRKICAVAAQNGPESRRPACTVDARGQPP